MQLFTTMTLEKIVQKQQKGSSPLKLRATKIHVFFFSFLHSNINNNEHHYYQCDVSKNGNVISWQWREQACKLSSQWPLAECIMFNVPGKGYAVSPPFHGNFATLNLLFLFHRVRVSVRVCSNRNNSVPLKHQGARTNYKLLHGSNCVCCSSILPLLWILFLFLF